MTYYIYHYIIGDSEIEDYFIAYIFLEDPSMEEHLTLFYGASFLISIIAFAYAAYLYLWVKRQPLTNAKIIKVADLIKKRC